MKRSLGIILLGLLLGTASCSSLSMPSLPSWPWSSQAPQPNATAEALFAEGTAHFNNKKYALAVDRFQRVKVEYPFSPEVIAAELKLAESYYLNKQYPEAAAAFREFQTLHPSNENIPFVLYHLGLVHFEQFTSSDRYQKVTEIAKGYFEQVVKNHANSPYAAQAKEKLVKCLEYLSEHEFNIAKFYFNEKKYLAASDRLEGILRRYAGMPVAVNALYYLGESYRLEKNNIKAALAYEALIQHYPNDPLAKNAQAQLSEVTKEKQDPLAMLLKRDGRPAFASSQQSAVSGQPEGGAIQNPKPKIQNEKNLNLVAKKEVVHEEPGEEKGMLRRVGTALNPLGWFSSDDKKKEIRSEKAASAKDDSGKKEESKGFFSSLWGSWSSSSRESNTVGAVPDPQLVGKVDESLKQKGIEPGAQNLAVRPPAPDLPKAEEAAPPPSNTAELLGSVDTALQKKGKKLPDLPPPPEPAPIFKASTAPGKSATPTTATGSSPATEGLMGSIDEALRRKGIDPSKRETAEKSGAPGAGKAASVSEAPTVTSRPKVELAPKLPQEKGPLFLGTVPSGVEGEKAKESQASAPAVAKPSGSAVSDSRLPQAVLKEPQKPAEKAAETKVTEKKTSPDDEEEKGAFDQFREDMRRVRDFLNPLNW